MLMKNQTDQIMPIQKREKSQLAASFASSPAQKFLPSNVSDIFIDFTALAFWHWLHQTNNIPWWHIKQTAEQHKFFFFCVWLFLQRSIKYVMMLKKIITNRVSTHSFIVLVITHRYIRVTLYTNDNGQKERTVHSPPVFILCSFLWSNSFGSVAMRCVIIESANGHKLYGKRSAQMATTKNRMKENHQLHDTQSHTMKK